METNEYPFLDSKTRPPLTGELGDIVHGPHSDEIIEISNGPTVSSERLTQKLHAKVSAGRTDAGFPVLRDGILIGMISSPDLALCLDRLEPSEGPVDCLVSSRVKHHIFEDDEDGFDPTDFTPLIDPAPLSLDIHASTEMVYECFVKLVSNVLSLEWLAHMIGAGHPIRRSDTGWQLCRAGRHLP